MLDLKDVRGLAAAFEAGALDPGQWTYAVEALQRMLGANGALLFNPDPAVPGALGVPAGGAIAGCKLYMAEQWFLEDPWTLAAGKFFDQPGKVSCGHQYLSRANLKRTRFYADFATEIDLEDILCLKVCATDDTLAPVTHLSVYRPPGAPPFDESTFAVLQYIWPNVRRAVQLHFLMVRHGVEGRVASQTLDLMPQPVWLLRDDGYIEFANSPAVRSMCQLRWVKTNFGRLVSLGTSVVVEVLKRASSARCHSAVVPLGQRICRLPIFLSAVPDTSPISRAWPLAKHLLTIVPPEELQVDEGWMPVIAMQFQLTKAELELVKLLATGRDLKDIAALQKVSYTTIRTHLSAVFSKTGLRRQADVIRLAIGR